MTDVALDDGVLASLTELLGKVEPENATPADFRECRVHMKSRDIAYMQEVDDGVWECKEEHCCKFPRAHLKPKHNTKPRFCHICKIVLNSEKQATRHFESTKHIAKVKEHNVENMKNRVARKEASARGSGEETEEKEGHSSEEGFSSRSTVSNSSGSIDASQIPNMSSPLAYTLSNAIPASPVEAPNSRRIMVTVPAAQQPAPSSAQRIYYAIQPQHLTYIQAFPQTLNASSPPQQQQQQQVQYRQQAQYQQVISVPQAHPSPAGQVMQIVVPQQQQHNGAQILQGQPVQHSNGTQVIFLSFN